MTKVCVLCNILFGFLSPFLFKIQMLTCKYKVLTEIGTSQMQVEASFRVWEKAEICCQAETLARQIMYIRVYRHMAVRWHAVYTSSVILSYLLLQSKRALHGDLMLSASAKRT